MVHPQKNNGYYHFSIQFAMCRIPDSFKKRLCQVWMATPWPSLLQLWMVTWFSTEIGIFFAACYTEKPCVNIQPGAWWWSPGWKTWSGNVNRWVCQAPTTSRSTTTPLGQGCWRRWTPKSSEVGRNLGNHFWLVWNIAGLWLSHHIDILGMSSS